MEWSARKEEREKAVLCKRIYFFAAITIYVSFFFFAQQQ